MPHGFYTVEQWNRRQWVPVLHLDADQSLTRAIKQLRSRGRAGLYRVIQTQRCIWAEMEHGKLRVHGCHASSPESLAELAKLFEAEGGRRPVEKAKQARLAAKAKRAKQR
jgi:hypothetical protein